VRIGGSRDHIPHRNFLAAPIMDKRTNSFNIAIVAVSLVNAILLVFFNNIKGVPPLVVGVMGVVFFLVNAIFALVLMILIAISVGYAIFSKNPDSRYMPMRDDRASFIKSSNGLPTELDALGATARGDIRAYHNYKPTRDFDDDASSSQTSFMKQLPPAPMNQAAVNRPYDPDAMWKRGVGYDQ